MVHAKFRFKLQIDGKTRSVTFEITPPNVTNLHKRELLAVSPEDFEDLKRRKILTYYRPPEDDMEGVRRPRCQHGCTLTVQRFGEFYEAFCLNHPEEDAIRIDEEDLNRWCFSIDALLKEIIRANGIQGGQKKIEPPCIYLDHKIYGSHRIGFVFLPRISDTKHLSLFGIRHLCHDEGLVLLTSASRLDEIPLESILHREKVVHATITDILDRRTFTLPIETLVAPLLPDSMERPRSAHEITEEQWRDYQICKYLCRDRIHIPGDAPMPRNNLILINGKPVNLPDAPFALLFRLAVALWQDKNGWIEIPDPGTRQPFSNLRKLLGEHLDSKDGKQFIENDGTKRYRLSTHPDFITCDREKLFHHPDDRTRRIARQWLKVPA